MLTCRHVAHQATDYMEGALPLRRRAAMAWHLRLCPNCRTYLDTLKRSIGLTRRAAAAPPAPEQEDALAAIFAARGKAPPAE